MEKSRGALEAGPVSVLGIAKNHLRYESLYRAFKNLQSRFQNLPWLPTLLFGNSDRQGVLIRSLRYAWSAVLGDILSIRTAPAPRTAYYSQDGMEHGTCLVKSTITLTLVPNSWQTPRVLGSGAEE